MKRFTDTEKWNDPWFRRLKPLHKLLWNYACDICDSSGVFELDFDLSEFRVGHRFTPEDLLVFGDRIQPLPNGKFLIKKFIPFQYGRLSISCRGHRNAISCITRNNLIECSDPNNPSTCIGYAYPMHTVSILPNDGTGRGKDRTGQDVLLSSSVQGVQGGITVKDSIKSVEELGNILKQVYRRSSKDHFDYFEQTAMAEIVREREAFLDELKEMLEYKKTAPYFPQSIRSLLESWSKTLDRARNDTPGVNGNSRKLSPNLFQPGPTKAEMDAELKRQEEEHQKERAAQKERLRLQRLSNPQQPPA